jgi:anti-sigma-K factor RskA
MTKSWTLDEVRAELGAYSLDALSPDERAAIDAHLSTCTDCRTELRALTEAATAMSHIVPSRPMDPVRSAEIRQRLLDRSKKDATDVRPIRPVEKAARPSTLPWWIAAAAAAAFVVAMVQRGSIVQERDDVRTALAAESLRVAQLRDTLAERERMLLALAGPDVKVVDLVANNRRPNARMFWAQATNTWTMFAHDLPVPAAGRTYQLWLITRDGQRISAGTFAPDQAGNAVVSAQYPLARDALNMIAVTDEPAGGVPQPTGEVVIAGQPR